MLCVMPDSAADSIYGDYIERVGVGQVFGGGWAGERPKEFGRTMVSLQDITILREATVWQAMRRGQELMFVR